MKLDIQEDTEIRILLAIISILWALQLFYTRPYIVSIVLFLFTIGLSYFLFLKEEKGKGSDKR